eukprot:scaffold1141_cov333-Pavlova_lutheri.AAC.48
MGRARRKVRGMASRVSKKEAHEAVLTRVDGGDEQLSDALGAQERPRELRAAPCDASHLSWRLVGVPRRRSPRPSAHTWPWRIAHGRREVQGGPLHAARCAHVSRSSTRCAWWRPGGGHIHRRRVCAGPGRTMERRWCI